jgi:xanthine dehydrogenase accessory factor
VVVVLDTVAGSTPREAGTAMLVRADGAWGTIGGGHLEQKAIALARAMLETSAAGIARHRFPLGPALGQCCGGVAHVSLVPCPRGVVPPELDVRGPEPLFNLVLYGAGHVGQALVDVLAGVECAITWIDSREQQFPARVPPNTRVEFSEDPAHDAAHAPPGGFHLVMTHSHALDFAIVHRLLSRGDAAWVGMIGSRTKRVTFERRLRERGIDATRVARLACPIGLPDITGKSPGVVAVAVAAQLLGLAGHAAVSMAETAVVI